MRFRYNLDFTTNILYEDDNGVKTKYIQDDSSNRRLGLSFHRNKFSKSQVSNLIPTIVREERDRLVCEKDIHIISKTLQQTPRTFDAYLQSLDSATQDLLQFTQLPDDGYQLAQAIRNKSAIGVADCSVKVVKKSSAIAWIITNATQSFVYEGQSGCPVFHDAIDSYSGEMFGIYVLLSALKVITEFHNVKKGQITIACDIDSSLAMSLESFSRVKSTDAYFDLIWTIQEIRSTLKFRIEAKV